MIGFRFSLSRPPPSSYDDGMPITFACMCGQRYAVPDDRAGKRGRCAACQVVFVVPTPVVPTATPPPVHIPITVATQPLSSRRRKPVPDAAIFLGGAFLLAAGVFVVGTDNVAGFVRGFLEAAARDALLIAMAGPLLLAVILSRCGVLSMGRWLAMALFFGFSGTIWLVFYAQARAQFHPVFNEDKIAELDQFCMPITVGLISAVAGSLLAAAIYPKK